MVQEEELVGLPRDVVPEEGTGTKVAYDLMTNELLLDGSARLNLATFVTTWMPPDAARLMAETADKNMIDKDEYPQTAEFERRCVNMIGRLWHAPGEGDVTGCSTTGSSEAAMLGGLALKWLLARADAGGRQADRPAQPGPRHQRPGVLGQVLSLLGRRAATRADGGRSLPPRPPSAALAHCDENTIGVVAILGSTFDGSYEPVSEICAALDALAAGGGPDIPVHVDAASGGFVAPFSQPDLVWDFALPRVHSINASGHKYGLVYPGVGWAIWRDEEALPRDLVFDVNYLGGSMPTFALNFSRPGSEVLAQYFMFLALGQEGYGEMQRASNRIARHIANGIAAIGPYRLITDGSELPVVAFTLAPEVTNYTVFDVSARLREFGWLVPAYTFPENREDLSVLRVVVRAGLTNDMADLFLADMRKQTEWLESLEGPMPKRRPEERESFRH